MNQSELILQNTLPDDIALNVASFLQVLELCSLGSCSKFWRELCSADYLWVSLSKDRWPALGISSELPIPLIINNSNTGSSSLSSNENIQVQNSSAKGWRRFYINKHGDMACRASNIVKFVEECTSPSKFLEIGDFVKAVQDLSLMDFGFKDVVMFFFGSKQNVLVNLAGLHYCIFWLNVSAEDVIVALRNCGIHERELCVSWWKLGRWFYGFRMRDESNIRRVSLGDLALAKENEVLGVLYRGAIHEVLRVQVSIPHPACITSLHAQ
ncbi:hypothetical protein MKX01_023100 [Papaver californicum]|nr:hypothetical protein MKX01_023100 [Papaver californicum]